jgi:hypothetical protein
MLSRCTCSRVDVDLLCDKLRDLHRKIHHRSSYLIDNCHEQCNARLAVDLNGERVTSVEKVAGLTDLGQKAERCSFVSIECFNCRDVEKYFNEHRVRVNQGLLSGKLPLEREHPLPAHVVEIERQIRQRYHGEEASVLWAKKIIGAKTNQENGLKHARNKRNKRLQLLDLQQKGSGNIKRTVRHKYKNIRKCTLETRHRKRAFTCPVKRPRILAESRSSKKPMS